MLNWLRRRKYDRAVDAIEAEPEPTAEELEMEILDAMNERDLAEIESEDVEEE